MEIRIAFFDATPVWSGGASRILFLAQKLKSEGAANPLIVCLPKSNLYKKAKESGIDTVGLKPLSDVGLISFIKILRLLKKNSVRIVDINSPRFYWLGLYASKILGIKTILTRNVPYRKKGLKKFINKYLLYKRCDAVISLSNKIKSELEDDYDIKNIHVIYDGLLSIDNGKDAVPHNNRPDRREIRSRLGLGDNDIALVTIGRIEESKGQLFAVAAVAKLIKQFPNIRLFIAGATGDANYKTRIENLIRSSSESDLKNAVRFLGFTDDISAVYRAADILVHPSLYDNIPFSILEAMGWGIPVVASRVGGIPEAVEDGVNGYLAKPADEDDLAQKIAQLIRQGDYIAMGEKGRVIVKEKFSAQKSFENYRKLITGEVLS